jgi:hypothetical protein
MIAAPKKIVQAPNFKHQKKRTQHQKNIILHQNKCFSTKTNENNTKMIAPKLMNQH